MAVKAISWACAIMFMALGCFDNFAMVASADAQPRNGARDDMRSCLRKDMAACDRVLSNPHATGNQLLNARFRKAHHLRENGAYERAIEEYSVGIKFYFDRTELRDDSTLQFISHLLVGRALAQYALGHFDAVVDDIKRLHTLNRDDPESFFLLASVYSARDQYDRAIDSLSAAIALDPVSVEYRTARGTACVVFGDLEGGIIDFSAAIGIDQDAKEALVGRAKAYLARGNIDLAISDLTRAVTLAPKERQLYVDRATAYEIKGQLENALKDYNRALADNRHDAPVLLKRAALNAAKGDQTAAIADLNAAIAADGSNATYYSTRAVVHAAKGDFDKAIADYSKAISLAPKESHYYAMRAWTYLKAGKPAQGLQDAERAVAQKPDRASALATRGLIYEALGSKEKAIADLDRALGLQPAMREARDALARLGKKPADFQETSEAVEPVAPVDKLAWLGSHTLEEKRGRDLYATRSTIFARSGPAYTFSVKAALNNSKGVKAVSVIKYATRTGCGIDTESAQLKWYKIKLANGEFGYLPDRVVVDGDPAATESASVTPSDSVVLNLSSEGESLFAGRAQYSHNYAEKIANFTRAIEADPSDPRTFGDRADAYYDAKKYDLALADLDRFVAMTATPRSDAFDQLRWQMLRMRAFFQRAMVYEAQERRKNAIADYRRVLNVDPDMKDAVEIYVIRKSREALERFGIRP